MHQAQSPGLRRLAVRGALIVGLRGVLSRIIALAGTVVLARTLETEEFGIFALGSALMICIDAVVRAGLGAGLIRRSGKPSDAELQTVVAVNGVLMVLAVVITAAVCSAVGGQVLTVAFMVMFMPLTALRTPGIILFERALSYRKLAQVEIFETTALYGFSAVLVAAGFGLTGVVVAAAARAVGGTLLMVRASSHGLVRPHLSLRIARELAAFAGHYQGAAVVNFARDQGANLGIAAVGGVTMLGVYAVASRVLQAPQILLEALFRVLYPAMSRLKEHGEDAGHVIERTVKFVALATGLIVAPLAAASVPLISAVFGERWSEAATVIPPVSLALMIGGPISVAAAGYLFAIDAGRIVLRSAVLHTIAWFAIALPLLGPLGVVAAGLGIVASSTVEALVLGRAVHRRTGARVFRGLVVPLLAATAGTGLGMIAIEQIDWGRALEAGAAALIAGGTFAIILLALQRQDVRGLVRLVRGAFGPPTT